MSRDGYLPDGVEQEDIDRYLCGDGPDPEEEEARRDEELAQMHKDEERERQRQWDDQRWAEEQVKP